VITYTLNLQPVYRARYDGASDSAKLLSEILERLLEMDEIHRDSAAGLVRRLATLADVSPSGFAMVLRFGSGDTGAIVQSYEQQSEHRGLTRQALHWQWANDLKAIALCFPEIAALLREYRLNIAHHEAPMSSADGLRDAMGGGPAP
jgi:hypothetical protein